MTPTAAGAFSCAFLIASNDADENPYSITVAGTATGNGPDIHVVGVLDGGNFAVGNQFVASPFTLQNAGNASLTLIGITFPTKTNCSIILTVPCAASVAAGASTGFTVQVTPTATGAFSCKVNIANNDPDENPRAPRISSR